MNLIKEKDAWVEMLYLKGLRPKQKDMIRQQINKLDKRIVELKEANRRWKKLISKD